MIIKRQLNFSVDDKHDNPRNPVGFRGLFCLFSYIFLKGTSVLYNY